MAKLSKLPWVEMRNTPVNAKITPMNTDVQTAWGMSYFKQRKYELAHEKFINAFGN
mgnify:CR=1 FL=1